MTKTKDNTSKNISLSERATTLLPYLYELPLPYGTDCVFNVMVPIHDNDHIAYSNSDLYTQFATRENGYVIKCPKPNPLDNRVPTALSVEELAVLLDTQKHFNIVVNSKLPETTTSQNSIDVEKELFFTSRMTSQALYFTGSLPYPITLLVLAHQWNTQIRKELESLGGVIVYDVTKKTTCEKIIPEPLEAIEICQFAQHYKCAITGTTPALDNAEERYRQRIEMDQLARTFRKSKPRIGKNLTYEGFYALFDIITDGLADSSPTPLVLFEPGENIAEMPEKTYVAQLHQTTNFFSALNLKYKHHAVPSAVDEFVKFIRLWEAVVISKRPKDAEARRVIVNILNGGIELDSEKGKESLQFLRKLVETADIVTRLQTLAAGVPLEDIMA